MTTLRGFSSVLKLLERSRELGPFVAAGAVILQLGAAVRHALKPLSKFASHDEAARERAISREAHDTRGPQ